jgi:hypothetical protein
MKLLVETSGAFQLLDNDNGQLIRFEGYTVVVRTSFVDRFAMFGSIKFICEVADEATDAEWLAYVKDSDGDLALALESFKASFPPEGAVAPEERPTPKKTKAKA